MKCTTASLVLLSTMASALASDIPGGGIRGDELMRHVQALASDGFEGRAPATPGEERTIAYIAGELRKAGVEPGGVDGGWLQPVPLVRARVEGEVAATVHVGGQSRALVNGEDLVLQTLQPVERVDVGHAPLVFVGYGVSAPERGWDDYKGVDLQGKVAVVLINDPDFETPEPGAFDGRGVTYHGRWTYKYEELARRGATGALIVHETAPAAYGWGTVRSSGLSPLFDIPRGDAMQAHTPLRGWIQRSLAEWLFAAAGLDFESEKKRAQTPEFMPVPLGDATLSAAFRVVRDEVVTHNVVGRIEGAQAPDEAVIYSAHWDAYGVGEADASGDTIRHGAVDNATGVAAVLELARVYAAGPRPRRSVLFMALTAEEKGLQGASYYAANPLVPLEKTAAVLNIEMLSPDGPTHDLSSWGKGRVSLEDMLREAIEAQGRRYSPDPSPESGFFYRADHFAFARAGVPAITVGAGLDRVDGGVASGQALRDRYFADCYHRPCDNWSPAWDIRGQVQDVEVLYALGRRIADDSNWPYWQEGSEFRAERLRSEATRGTD
jgi:Zn-dependent M28 family amino/carboxypeptidase